MFVTIITIILLTIAFTLWAIIYGGSRNISDKEQKFVDKEEEEFIKEWQLKQEKKLNDKLLRKINKNANKTKLKRNLRWNKLWH